MVAIVATLAAVGGLGIMLSARKFVDLAVGLVLVGVGIYLIGYSPWL
jgi:hypothetical protein